MESEVRNRKTNSNKSPIHNSEKIKTIRSECTPAKRRNSNNEGVERLLGDEPADAAVSAIEPLQNDEKDNFTKSEKSPITRLLASAADKENSRFNINIDVDPMSIALFVVAFCTRIYRLAEPNNIV